MATRTCIVVADRARARFFIAEDPPEHRSAWDSAKLEEVEALTEPEGELTGSDLFANTRSGTNRAPSGVEYQYDDHRERHRQETERRFAKRIAESLGKFVRREHVGRVVLGAEPHMLGLLRGPVSEGLPADAELVTLPEDLSWHTPERIQSVLVRQGIVAGPRRHRPNG